MRRSLVRLAVAAGIVAGASLAFAFASGPPNGVTGAPAIAGVPAEALCTDCHTSFLPNVPGATLEILDLPQHYDLNTVYNLRVRMTSQFPPPRRWGFEITAVRESDGQGGGTLLPPTTNRTQTSLGLHSRRYVKHTALGTFNGDLGPVEWSFQWQSPLFESEGRIIFFCSGNAANSNSQSSGDHIYTTRDTIEFNAQVDVATTPNPADLLEAARPNPFREATTLGYALADRGRVDLSIFDAQGRRVRSLVSGDRPAGRASVSWDGRHDDGRAARPGVYLVRLVTPGASRPLVRRVVLAR